MREKSRSEDILGIYKHFVGSSFRSIKMALLIEVSIWQIENIQLDGMLFCKKKGAFF